jgi:hypothetical protein
VRCGGGIGGDATMASTSQGKEGNGAEPEQARRGRCDDDVAGEVERERGCGCGYARAHVDDQRRRGKRRGATAALRLINKKIPTLLNNTIFLALPPLESAQAKCRLPYLGPLDEV